MTNLQLFIAVGIPSLIVLINLAVTVSSNGRLHSRMDRLEDRMETRFQMLESRLQKLEDELGEVKVSLANLRAELFEKFQMRTS